MKYDDYSVSDLVNDSFFIRWVKSPDEKSTWFWESFVGEDPERSLAIEKARELVSLLDFSVNDLPEEELNSMRNILLITLRKETEGNRDSHFPEAGWFSMGTRKWRLAAAIIIFPLVFSLVLSWNRSRSELAFVRTGQNEELVRRENPVGQKSILFLSDGTKVWLNAASKLTYATDFTEQDTRDVYLEGEAFFDVAHDDSKPFIVHTSSIKIKVLGTSFNVKSYSEESIVEATLIAGKVRIEQSGVRGKRIGDVELKPNQRAVFNKKSKVINIKEVEADHSLSWKSERLIFDEESIDNVILQVERWFNVKIHAANRGKLDCKLTASIQRESLQEVLKLIETTHNIHYSIIGNQVFIEGKLCDSGK